ncbi:MAG: HAD family phosphatase [Xanthomonadaceae bacterium]|nr:HAD family phosphatase [Xanthomonadaceae bacterium]
MKSYDSIIFDFGGVILPINFQRTINAFKVLGMELDSNFGFLSQSPIFDQWDKGLVDTQQILRFFRSKLSGNERNKTSDAALVSAWNAILGQIPLHRVEWLEKLSAKLPLFLFSNTNHIHIDRLREVDPLMPRFEKVFKKAYYSYEMRMRKPDADGFLKIASEQGLKIEHTLFVDDHPKNIEAASKLGFQTLHCTGEITQLLD